MALGTNHMTGTTDGSPAGGTQGVFIPELWSDEVLGAYKSNLVLANLISKMNHNGKKGDTVHIPVPTRGTANPKAVETQVVLNTATDTDKPISINQHYEYSRLIEDILSKQALTSMRAFYTDDAGYALATQVDTALWIAAYNLQAGDGAATNFGDKAVLGGDGSTLFVGANDVATALTDAGIRTIIQKLDDSDTPMSDRFLVVPPVEKKNLTGIARFTEQAFVGEAAGSSTIRTGLIGDMYGVPIYVSTNAPTDVAGSQDSRACLLAHKSALVLIEQMGVRTQTQYKQEWLGDLFTADTIYGVGELRDTAGIVIAVPA